MEVSEVPFLASSALKLVFIFVLWSADGSGYGDEILTSGHRMNSLLRSRQIIILPVETGQSLLLPRFSPLNLEEAYVAMFVGQEKFVLWNAIVKSPSFSEALMGGELGGGGSGVGGSKGRRNRSQRVEKVVMGPLCFLIKTDDEHTGICLTSKAMGLDLRPAVWRRKGQTSLLPFINLSVNRL